MTVRVVGRLLAGLGAMAVAVSACDPGSLENSGPTIGALSALALYSNAGRSHEDACSMNASWPLPAWPSTSRSDTVTVHFTRQVVLPPAAAMARDTLVTNVVVRLDRQDSTHLTLRIGAPFGDSLSGTLDPSTGQVLTAAWACQVAFPFGQDSTLLAHGYQADSLGAGTMALSRYAPVD